MSTNKNSLSLAAIVLLLALLGLNAYQWFNSGKLKSQLKTQETQYLELEKVNTELDFNYQAKLEELEVLRGDNSELNALIDTQKEELSKQKRRISELIWTQKELGKARSELDNLNAMANKYIAEIRQLKGENSDLRDANSELTDSNTKLNEEAMVNRKRINNLDSVKNVLVTQTEVLTADNETLSSKVDIAEAIKINYIDVQGLTSGGREKNKAKKVTTLRTCFTTETNVVTPSGQKEFFVRYTNPSGEVLCVENNGGGKLTNKMTGESVKYTSSGETTYNNDEMKACIDWNPGFSLGKGVYKVEIFNNGYEVGQGEFKLK